MTKKHKFAVGDTKLSESKSIILIYFSHMHISILNYIIYGFKELVMKRKYLNLSIISYQLSVN